MAVKKGQSLELSIDDVAFGGKGLARVDGLAVFVDGAVPLDRVMARVTKKKRQYAEARIETLVDPSPHRVPAPCMYSGFCGGCKWQHLDYKKQLVYKQQHVRDSLERIGNVHGTLIHPTIPSHRIFEYRNKMEFSCSDRRWLLPDEMGKEDINRNFALGLHVPGTFYKVLDTRECLLQPEMGNHILDTIRTYMVQSNAPVYGLRTHVGFWRFAMLRHSAAYDQWMVNIITASEDRKMVQPLADRLMETYPRVVSVVNNITSRRAGIAVGEYEIRLAGTPRLTDKIAGYTFEISANSFFQTNTLGAERLYETIKAYAGLTGRETVVDLYSGTGSIAVCIADSAQKVIGIEIVESALADAYNNCRINGISNCRFIHGDIRDCLSQVYEPTDVMIIDPPRAGMHKDVVRQVLDMASAKIVYVSCNPSTLARDIGMMKEQYHLSEVQPVDMFPHTYHIEAVARLELL
ncbi:23S rRNA (uracil(1939)-C(5))-methyltransferase RlmD [Thermodesulfobacteriota bacterium]